MVQPSPPPPEAINTAQKVVALDARYNAHRPLPHQHSEFPSQQHLLVILQDPCLPPGMLYIRRRNQLLQDNAKNTDEPSIRKTYLQLRTRILAARYGPSDRRSVTHCCYELYMQSVIRPVLTPMSIGRHRLQCISGYSESTICMNYINRNYMC